MSRKLTFDYIIVGTGPAGAVIAKTLSDNKEVSVLVLEAGGNNDKDTPIKDSTFALELEEQFFPQYFWQGKGFRKRSWMSGHLNGQRDAF